MKTTLLITIFLLTACASTPPPVDALKLCTDWCFQNNAGAACVGMIRRMPVPGGVDYSPVCMPKENVGEVGAKKAPTNGSNPGKKK